MGDHYNDPTSIILAGGFVEGVVRSALADKRKITTGSIVVEAPYQACKAIYKGAKAARELVKKGG